MREQNMIKFIKKALKEEHLYSSDELSYMKKELANLEYHMKELRKLTSKGFGK